MVDRTVSLAPLFPRMVARLSEEAGGTSVGSIEFLDSRLRGNDKGERRENVVV